MQSTYRSVFDAITERGTHIEWWKLAVSEGAALAGWQEETATATEATAANEPHRCAKVASLGHRPRTQRSPHAELSAAAGSAMPPRCRIRSRTTETGALKGLLHRPLLHYDQHAVLYRELDTHLEEPPAVVTPEIQPLHADVARSRDPVDLPSSVIARLRSSSSQHWLASRRWPLFSRLRRPRTLLR
jgi:hypothetical protein